MHSAPLRDQRLPAQTRLRLYGNSYVRVARPSVMLLAFWTICSSGLTCTVKLPSRLCGKLGSLERSSRKQLAAAPMQRPLEPGTLMVPLEALRAGGALPKPVERAAGAESRDELVEGQAVSAASV